VQLAVKRHSVLPGFGLTMGCTLAYLGLVILIPLAALIVQSVKVDWEQFRTVLSSPEVVAAFRLSFGASLAAALVNAVFGLIVAWVLVRYNFPGKRVIDAIVDLPFALPTAVSGITLTILFSEQGWLGQWLVPWGIKVVESQLGITVALVFIGLPFVVRTLQPALEELDPEVEEAAASLGANRLQTFCRVIMPMIMPALLAGFAMAFARGLGEYGSVVFIAGNLPMKTEIVPMVIINKLTGEHNVVAACAMAVVMLAASFVLLLLINMLQWWSRRHV
jgi:sulfate/thiosulfate transport system permease protein